nr:hypothetical protein [Tanacetum cinerariifolium]
LEGGQNARAVQATEDELEAIADLQLLTIKPVIYVANVDEASIATDGNKHVAALREHVKAEGAQVVLVSAAIEKELVDKALLKLAHEEAEGAFFALKIFSDASQAEDDDSYADDEIELFSILVKQLANMNDAEQHLLKFVTQHISVRSPVSPKTLAATVN